jgi:hypothetical protein
MLNEIFFMLLNLSVCTKKFMVIKENPGLAAREAAREAERFSRSSASELSFMLFVFMALSVYY